MRHWDGLCCGRHSLLFITAPPEAVCAQGLCVCGYGCALVAAAVVVSVFAIFNLFIFIY